MTIFRAFSADLSTRAGTLTRRRAALPLLLLAVALAALAAFLVHDSRPAAAQQITVFHHVAALTPKLQNTGFLGCSNSGGAGETPCSTAISDSTFTYKGTERTIFWALLTPGGDFHLYIAPTEKASELVGLTARVGVEKTVNGVTTVEIKSFDLTSDILIGGTYGWDDTGMTWVENSNVYLAFHDMQDAPEISFGGATISDKTYTAGARANQVFTSAWDQGLPRLPMAVGGGYTHTYTATGLPAGLRIGYDLVIRGTPEAATSEPAQVTYTVTDEVNQTASLTFNVTVKPPVEFNASELADFHGTYLEYTIGQDGGLSATMPSASGGHGDLTYSLDYYDPAPVSEYKPVDDLSGFSFDASTRTLTSDSGSGAPSVAGGYAIRYSVVDTNGSRQEAFSRLAVFAAPTFAALEDVNLTAGEAASVTLPKASGGAKGPDVDLSYALSPEIAGLAFDGPSRTLSGTPEHAGSFAMTYTATDANGVSGTATFTVTVANAGNAPTDAPGSVLALQAGAQGVIVTWGAVSGATGYVVQVILDGGSFPASPVASVPDGIGLRQQDCCPTRAQLLFEDSSDYSGTYKVRVAARNDDGVGPWSTEASVTVNIGGL